MMTRTLGLERRTGVFEIMGHRFTADQDHNPSSLCFGSSVVHPDGISHLAEDTGLPLGTYTFEKGRLFRTGGVVRLSVVHGRTLRGKVDILRRNPLGEVHHGLVEEIPYCIDGRPVVGGDMEPSQAAEVIALNALERIREE